MLSDTQPRLITQLQRRVPPGVNGGVTWLGLAASAAGGLCMGAVVSLLGWLTGETQHLSGLISSGMRLEQQGLLASSRPAVHAAVLWMGLSLVCGLAGSLFDSLLGATLQYSGYDTSTGKVVAAPGGPHVKHISGRPWLSNDAVNASSALLASAGAAAVGAYVAAAAAAVSS